MTLILIAWLTIGFAHWLDWMMNYSYKKFFVMDVIIALPTFLAFGPITTIRKFLN